MRTLCIFLMLILRAASASGQGFDLNVPFTQFTLHNGLNVILHEDLSTTFVTVDVWYHVGSARDAVGQTGLAHLFEHLMFRGSANVPEGGALQEWLGGGETGHDFTSYDETVPSHALELALFLESDRMGHLVDAMSPGKVDAEREVVKNERRQIYENPPYGLALHTFFENLFPRDHPYHRPIVGYMDDLTAASYEDVVRFYRTYYSPNNASLVVAGNIDIEETRGLVEKWFGDIPGGPPVIPIEAQPAILTDERRVVLEDRVQLPRLYIVWQTPPAFNPGNAEMKILADLLANGKTSRLHRSLIDERQVAQDVEVYQWDLALSSVLWISVTARPGYTLTELEAVIEEEIRRLHIEPPTALEVQRAVSQHETAFLDRMERLNEKAYQLNRYYLYTGTPGYFNEDLARFTTIQPGEVQAVARRYLTGNRVVLSVVPEGKAELAAVPQRQPTQ